MKERISVCFDFDGRVVNDLQSSRAAIPFKDSVKNVESNRFIAWNVMLGILTDNSKKWAQDWIIHNNWYWNIVKEYFDDGVCWVDLDDSAFQDIHSLPVDDQDQMSVIHQDVIRACSSFLKDFSPGKKASPEIHRRIERILYVIAVFSPEMHYTQGFDRFAFILYILSLKFFEERSIDADFAESIAYALTVRMLLLTRFYRVIDSTEHVEGWFTEYVELLGRFKPEIALRLKATDIHPTQYAFRWCALLFADEHPPKEIFLIWDQCILRNEDIQTYVFCQCVAHIAQLHTAYDSDAKLIENMHKFRAWSIEKLIDDSNFYYRMSKLPDKKSVCCFTLPSFINFEA